MNETTEPGKLWNLLVILAVLMGASITVAMFNKERFIPAEVVHDTEHAGHDVLSESEPRPDTTVASTPYVEDHSPAKEHIEASAGKAPSSKYMLVVASFRSERYALHFAETVKAKMPGEEVRVVESAGEEKYYRVVIAMADSWKQIALKKKEVQQSGYDSCWVAERLRATSF